MRTHTEETTRRRARRRLGGDGRGGGACRNLCSPHGRDSPLLWSLVCLCVFFCMWSEERRFSFLGLFSGFSPAFLILFFCFSSALKEKKRKRKDQEKTKKRQEKTRKAREWSPRPNSAPTASCPSPPPSLSTLDSRPFNNSLSRLPPPAPHT